MSAQTLLFQETTSSEEETVVLAERFIHEHAPRGIVALRGELGAGKTRFVRGVVRAMGGDERDVSSPTFAIVNEYACGETTVGHMDAYRLSGGDELETVGWDELLARCDVLLIEWAERIEDRVREDSTGGRYDVSITHVGTHAGEDARRITITRIEPEP